MRNSSERVLGYASDELKNDKKFILEVVKINCGAIDFASDVLQNDKEVILECLKRGKIRYSYFFFESQNDFIKTKSRLNKFSKKFNEMIFILVEKMKINIAKKQQKIKLQINSLM